jgi:hypothetical protein
VTEGPRPLTTAELLDAVAEERPELPELDPPGPRRSEARRPGLRQPGIEHEGPDPQVTVRRVAP